MRSARSSRHSIHSVAGIMASLARQKMINDGDLRSHPAREEQTLRASVDAMFATQTAGKDTDVCVRQDFVGAVPARAS